MYGKVVGFLDEMPDRRHLTFKYKNEWFKNGFPLCPSMPLEERDFVSERLHNVFLDATPDGWGRRILQKAEDYASALTGRNSHRLDDFECFARSDNFSRQGAIEVENQGRCNIEGIADDIHMPVLNIMNVDRDRDSADDVFRCVRQGISPGGARPKFPVLFDGELFLVKVRSRDDIVNVPGWEAVNLELAKLCGITVPVFTLLQKSIENVEYSLLCVKRFDRHESTKIPYISARTMLDVDASDHSASYADIAATCQDCDKKELFIRMAFNAVISNFDDHPRNHGFLYCDGKWRLSPVFDIESIPMSSESRHHSLIVGNNSSYSCKRNILANHADFGLTHSEAESILRGVHAAVQDSWKDFAREYVGNKKEILSMASCYNSMPVNGCITVVGENIEDSVCPTP
jgi:serine/threonine-protein kinase HipA